MISRRQSHRTGDAQTPERFAPKGTYASSFFSTTKPSDLPAYKRSFDLSPLLPSRCAFFAYHGASQPLTHQSLPHSLPFNGGGSPLYRLFASTLVTYESPLVGVLCFQQLATVPIFKLFVFKSLQQWGGCMGG